MLTFDSYERRDKQSSDRKVSPVLTTEEEEEVQEKGGTSSLTPIMLANL